MSGLLAAIVVFLLATVSVAVVEPGTPVVAGLYGALVLLVVGLVAACKRRNQGSL